MKTTFKLGLCNYGKSDISIIAINFYRFISIMLSAKNLVLSVSSSNLNWDKAGFKLNVTLSIEEKFN